MVFSSLKVKLGLQISIPMDLSENPMTSLKHRVAVSFRWLSSVVLDPSMKPQEDALVSRIATKVSSKYRSTDALSVGKKRKSTWLSPGRTGVSFLITVTGVKVAIRVPAGMWQGLSEKLAICAIREPSRSRDKDRATMWVGLFPWPMRFTKPSCIPSARLSPFRVRIAVQCRVRGPNQRSSFSARGATAPLLVVALSLMSNFRVPAPGKRPKLISLVSKSSLAPVLQKKSQPSISPKGRTDTIQKVWL